ncbi:hypothetical protein [Kribbella solani]|uniref:Uncharacterized protein n=1 Tax=Kribbella solani TaxID=236067 RepID=A0A841E0N9_9ACTN|nr:hypothetical protein [Kribbella solani]MBB5984019.1 hypothetical protein [Kribbella solani]
MTAGARRSKLPPLPAIEKQPCPGCGVRPWITHRPDCDTGGEFACLTVWVPRGAKYPPYARLGREIQD